MRNFLICFVLLLPSLLFARGKKHFNFDMGEYVYRSLSLNNAVFNVSPTFSKELIRRENISVIKIEPDSGDAKWSWKYRFDKYGRCIGLSHLFTYEYDSLWTEKGIDRISKIIYRNENDFQFTAFDTLTILYDSLARPVFLKLARKGNSGLNFFYDLAFDKSLRIQYANSNDSSFAFFTKDKDEWETDTMCFDHRSGRLSIISKRVNHIELLNVNPEKYLSHEIHKMPNDTFLFVNAYNYSYNILDTGFCSTVYFQGWTNRYSLDAYKVHYNPAGLLTYIELNDGWKYRFQYDEKGLPELMWINYFTSVPSRFRFEICRYGEKCK